MPQNIFDNNSDDKFNLDAQSPYPGLHPFREKDKDYFFGRRNEINDLLHRIEKDLLTVVLGKSGLGKTSILQAGIIPGLRKNYFLPIYVQTRFAEDNERDLLEQVKSIIEEKVKAVDKKAVSIEDLSLWEYFHKVKIFDGLIKPLLIFDQFEEILKIGRDSPERINPLIIEIGDLVQDWVPLVVQEKFRDVGIPYGDKAPDYRVVFSLREDYLAQLMNLRGYMPSIVNGRYHYRMLQVRGENAVDAILKPGTEIIKDEKVAIEIIEKFPESKDSEYIPCEMQSYSWENRKIDPFLLSLFCYKVNEKRKKIKADEISSKFLKGVSLAGVVKEYYEDVIDQFDHGVKFAIETELLTPTGERKFQEINSLKEKYHIPEEDFERLVDKRILREERRNDVIYIELIHDTLAPIIKEKREKRLREIEKQKIWEQLKTRYYRGVVAISVGLAIIFFVIAAFALFERNRANEQYRDAQVNRLTAEALLEFPKDNIRAIRIAEAAYKMEMSDPSPGRMKTLSDIGYSSNERPFYAVNLHHNEAVYSAVFSDDGKRILTASEDGTAKLWDSHGNFVKQFTHKARVSSAVFSPDGNQILTASWDKTAKIWDLGSEMSVNFPHKAVVTSAVFSHQGDYILTTARDGTATVWNCESKKPVTTVRHNGVSSAAFAPDGSRILTASWDKTVMVWTRDGGFLFDLEHNGAVSSAVFSKDGSWILTASDDGIAKLWSREGKHSEDIKHNGALVSAVFSHDEKRILTASRDGTIKIWSIEKWHIKNEFPIEIKCEAGVSSVVSSKGGSRILVASNDGTAKILDLKNNITASFTGHTKDVNTAVLSPDERWVLTASSDTTAKLWKPEGQYLREFPHRNMVTSAVFSPDSKRILTTAGQRVIVWDLKANQLMNYTNPDGSVTSAVFSHDGERILTASVDGTAKVLRIEGEKAQEKLILEHQGSVSSAVFSPNSRRILTASANGTAKVWTWKEKQFSGPFLELKHNGPVSSAVFSPDGLRILTASYDGTTKYWDIRGNLLANFSGFKGVVNSAVFSKDGRWILSASRDRTAKKFATPETIFNWLKTAKIPHLSGEDKQKLGIFNLE